MKNKLTDLNDHLFAQIERLSDDSLSSDALDAEVRRTGAVVELADMIVANARLQLDACKLSAEHGERIRVHLPLLGVATEAKS